MSHIVVEIGEFDHGPLATIFVDGSQNGIMKRPSTWADIQHYLEFYAIDPINIRPTDDAKKWMKEHWGEETVEKS